MKQATLQRLGLIAITLCIHLSGQAQIDAGSDTVFCDPGNYTLRASITGNLKSTNAYAITTVPFNPYPFTGNQVQLNDDEISAAIPIGFDFCFFGNAYTQFYISSNGWIGFSPNQSANYVSSSIPTTNSNVPKNCIMGPWQDWDPENGGQIKYTVVGNRPNRKLVVSWDQIPLYTCNSSLGRFQIVLFEGDNSIETYIENKPDCAWSGGIATHGLHNDAGTVAFAVLGHNGTQWTATNEAHRFKPDGAVSGSDITWLDDQGNTIATGLNHPVNFSETTYYIAQLDNCGGGNYTDTVNLYLLDVNITWQDALCYGESNSKVTVTPTTDLVSLDYFLTNTNNDTLGRLFSQNAAFNVNGLGAGTYFLSTKWPGNCSFYDTITIAQPDSITLLVEFEPETCAKKNGYIHTITYGGTGDLSLNWNTGDSVNDLNNLDSGYYALTVVDTNGCTKFFDVYFPHTIAPTSYFELDRDSISLLNPVVNFTYQGQGGTSFYWDFNDGTRSTALNPSHSFTETGQYEVALVIEDSNGCADFFYRTVKVYDADYFIPNAFRPNGDGFNDTFRMYFRDETPRGDFQLLIFNRWGELVHESTDPLGGWDGLIMGTNNLAPEGMYAFAFRLVLENGEILEKRGSVLLLN